MEYINIENETRYLLYTDNITIICKKDKEELLFLDKKNNFQNLFRIKNIKNNEQSKMIEINKNIICLTYENIIQIIDIEKKSLINAYDKLKINNLLSYDMINKNKIIISGDSEDKSLIYILEFNDSYNKLSEKKVIENLKCYIVKQIVPDKIILHTNYGINILEI